MASNNMLNPAVNPDIEDDLFAQEVAQVKAWWNDSRWKHTKRPFTAEQIVSKRGHLKIEYPSNAQSKKLWNILEGRFQVCACTLFGFLEQFSSQLVSPMPRIASFSSRQPFCPLSLASAQR